MLDFRPLSFSNITWKYSIKMRNLKFGTRKEFNIPCFSLANASKQTGTFGNPKTVFPRIYDYLPHFITSS